MEGRLELRVEMASGVSVGGEAEGGDGRRWVIGGACCVPDSLKTVS